MQTSSLNFRVNSTSTINAAASESLPNNTVTGSEAASQLPSQGAFQVREVTQQTDGLQCQSLFTERLLEDLSEHVTLGKQGPEVIFFREEQADQAIPAVNFEYHFDATDEELQIYLTTVLEQCPKLGCLTLKGCRQLTDAHLELLVNNPDCCASLRALNLFDCDKITDAGLAHLKHVQYVQT